MLHMLANYVCLRKVSSYFYVYIFRIFSQILVSRACTFQRLFLVMSLIIDLFMVYHYSLKWKNLILDNVKLNKLEVLV